MGTWLRYLAVAFAGVVAGSFIAPIGVVEALKSTGGEKIACRQKYPNIPGRVVLDNDKVVVQAFTFPPGVWEGVHAHPPNQIYIMLDPGKWKVRYGKKETVGFSPKGEVGWYGPVELSEDHESVNISDKPVDLIWVTLKGECRDEKE